LLLASSRVTRAPLFANAGYLLAIEIVNSLFGFLFWGLATRLYQPAEVGTATAALSAVALVSGIAGLGIGNGIIRFLPEAQPVDRLVNSGFTFVVMAGLVIGTVFLVGLPIWSPSLLVLQRSVPALAGFLLFSIIMTLNAAVRSVFVAHRRALYAFIHAIAVNGLRLPLLAVLTGWRSAGILLSIGLGFFLAFGLSLAVLLPRLQPHYRFRPQLDVSILRVVLPFSLGNHVAGLLAQSSRMLLPLMILEMLGPVSSGHAYIAWMLGSFLMTPGLALAGSAFAEGANAPHDSARIVTRAAAIGFLLTCGGALVMGLGAPRLLLLFGPTYAQESADLLRWLAAAGPLAVVTQLYFTHMRVQQCLRSLIVGSGVIAGATLGISACWMPRVGIAATGMGWAVANGLVTIAALASACHRGTCCGLESTPGRIPPRIAAQRHPGDQGHGT
jgi:O-antigen/teichoic acid export membrane protein